MFASPARGLRVRAAIAFAAATAVAFLSLAVTAHATGLRAQQSGGAGRADREMVSGVPDQPSGGASPGISHAPRVLHRNQGAGTRSCGVPDQPGWPSSRLMTTGAKISLPDLPPTSETAGIPDYPGTSGGATSPRRLAWLLQIMLTGSRQH